MKEVILPAMIETIIVDGVLINPETGEILGTVDPRFCVESLETAEWVLDRIGRHEAQVVALEARKAALIANIDSMIATERRSIDGLHYRFDGELSAWARDTLGKDAKTKTIKTAFGTVAFRNVPTTRKVVDEEAALAWAEENAPGIVRTKKSVTQTDVLGAWDALDESGSEPKFVELRGGGETVTIKTNVGSK